MHATYQVFVMLLAEKCQYIQGKKTQNEKGVRRDWAEYWAEL